MKKIVLLFSLAVVLFAFAFPCLAEDKYPCGKKRHLGTILPTSNEDPLLLLCGMDQAVCNREPGTTVFVNCTKSNVSLTDISRAIEAVNKLESEGYIVLSVLVHEQNQDNDH